MNPEEIKASLEKLPSDKFGPVEVFSFRHRERDVLRMLMMAIGVWEMVREDLARIKAMKSGASMCGVYISGISFEPLRIILVLAADFDGGNMQSAEAVLFLSDIREAHMSACMKIFSEDAVQFFCDRFHKMHKNDSNVFIKL